MDDLISRKALLDCMPKDDQLMSLYVRRCICDAPAVDAEPVRHGKWVYHDDDMMPYKSCSLCGCEAFDLQGANYCPYCGAKMDMEKEEE